MLNRNKRNEYKIVIYSSFNFFGLSTVGNAIILAAYVKFKSLRKIGSEFILTKVFADLCVLAVADPLCVIGKL